jgi:hypothetical protein
MCAASASATGACDDMRRHTAVDPSATPVLQRCPGVRPLPKLVGMGLRLRGGTEMRDARGISEERFGSIWGGPVLWRKGYYDPLEDRATGWEYGGPNHGDCVSWCDWKDEELTRAEEEKEKDGDDRTAAGEE